MDTSTQKPLERATTETLSFTITGFSQATGIGATTIYEAARTGELKTRLLGSGKRKKRIILKGDGLKYLHSFPLDSAGEAV